MCSDVLILISSSCVSPQRAEPRRARRRRRGARPRPPRRRLLALRVRITASRRVRWRPSLSFPRSNQFVGSSRHQPSSLSLRKMDFCPSQSYLTRPREAKERLLRSSAQLGFSSTFSCESAHLLYSASVALCLIRSELLHAKTGHFGPVPRRLGPRRRRRRRRPRPWPHDGRAAARPPRLGLACGWLTAQRRVSAEVPPEVPTVGGGTARYLRTCIPRDIQALLCVTTAYRHRDKKRALRFNPKLDLPCTSRPRHAAPSHGRALHARYAVRRTGGGVALARSPRHTSTTPTLRGLDTCGFSGLGWGRRWHARDAPPAGRRLSLTCEAQTNRA